LVHALVAIPLVATGGIGTGAAIAAVLVAPADKPDAIAASCSPLGRELDAFRQGNYVPIINEHY
jgi:hypothetical protein